MAVVERTKAKPATERDVLHRAADLLEEFGWLQHFLGSKEQGAMCLFGAILEADNDFGRDSIRATITLGLMADYLGSTIQQWNDEPGRTKAEVVTALREAAGRNG